jgi:hypothetical protein
MDLERYRPIVAVRNHHEEDYYVPQIQRLSVPLCAVSDAPSPAAKKQSEERNYKQIYPETPQCFGGRLKEQTRLTNRETGKDQSKKKNPQVLARMGTEKTNA